MNWDYLAGFFDGEGWVQVSKAHLLLAVSNADFEVLREIQAFTGTGTLRLERGRLRRFPNRKPLLTWCVGRGADIERLTHELIPRCRTKKAALRKAVTNRPPRSHVERVRNKVLQLYNSGLTLCQVEERLELGRGTVHKWMQRRGIARRPQGTRGVSCV